jgi:hypothetical protein
MEHDPVCAWNSCLDLRRLRRNIRDYVSVLLPRMPRRVRQGHCRVPEVTAERSSNRLSRVPAACDHVSPV